MEPSEQNCCVCCEFLSSSEITTRTRDILEILKFLLINVNHKLLQDSIICESCLAKLQSAYKFKILYSEGFQKSLDNTTIETGTNLEKFLMCGICKKILDPSDSVPFDYSLSIRSTLIKHFPMEFESKVPDNVQTCEECHKLLLNFCTITNSLSIFEQNSAVINKFDNTEHRQYFQNTYDIYNSNSHNFKFDIKEEGACEFQDTKDVDCILQDMKQENEDSNYQEFVLKNEAIDLKTDVNSEDEMNWKSETYNLYNLNRVNFNSDNDPPETTKTSLFQEGTECYIRKKIDTTEIIFQCPICEFQTRYKRNVQLHMLIHKNIDESKMLQCKICEFRTQRKENLRKHMLVHRTVDEVAIFQCTNCGFQTKRKESIKKHMLVHENPDNIEMFQCQNCEFRTKRKDSLKKHMLIHRTLDKIEMFHCQVCEFQTKRKDTLKKHMLVHSSPDNIEMFQCQYCKYRTKRKSTLKRHVMLVHKKC